MEETNNEIEQSEENKEKAEENILTQEPVDKEYERLMKKQKQQEAQLNLMIAQEQAFQMQQEEQRRIMDEHWVDSTRCLVSKQCMIDLYFSLFVGNENEAFNIVEALCNSMSSYEGHQEENRMLIDKTLMTNLNHYFEKRDERAMYDISNNICYNLSVGQRREIVNVLVNQLMQEGSIEDANLIEALKQSIGDPGFFRT